MDEINQQPNITIQTLGSASIATAPMPPTPPVVPIVTEEAVPAVIAPNMEPDRVSYADAQIQEIEVAKIAPNPYQPRKTFDPTALKELADSIKEHGVIQPLVVTKTPIGYELVVGERRFRASQLAGMLLVPAIIKEAMVDQTKLEVALIENIQRQELNPIEEAQAYERLMKTFNMTQEQVAKKVGKSRPAVANTVRLLNLPAEIQRGVIEGKIMEGHARAILGLLDPEKMLLMYKMVQEQNLNVRQVEAKVRELTAKRQMDSAAPDPKLMALETELRGKLGTQVKIQRQGQGGKITIEFFSEEELSELVHKMAAEQNVSNLPYLTV
jgi:ParB family chromosome partitioning protein